MERRSQERRPRQYRSKAAAWYWPRLFQGTPLYQHIEAPLNPDDFIRERYGDWPNCLLNYGYAVLRAVVARALIGAGLLPTLGIHHRNQYNAYCLADDIMEPYRPIVDALVCQILHHHPHPPEPDKKGDVLSPALKKELLVIPVADVLMEKKRKPLQVAAQRTAASLAACFAGTETHIVYPELS